MFGFLGVIHSEPFIPGGEAKAKICYSAMLVLPSLTTCSMDLYFVNVWISLQFGLSGRTEPYLLSPHATNTTPIVLSCIYTVCSSTEQWLYVKKKPANLIRKFREIILAAEAGFNMSFCSYKVNHYSLNFQQRYKKFLISSKYFCK